MYAVNVIEFAIRAYSVSHDRLMYCNTVLGSLSISLSLSLSLCHLYFCFQHSIATRHLWSVARPSCFFLFLSLSHKHTVLLLPSHTIILLCLLYLLGAVNNIPVHSYVCRSRFSFKSICVHVCHLEEIHICSSCIKTAVVFCLSDV